MKLKQRLDALFGDAVEAGELPGVVALATNRDGVFYEAGFGEQTQGGGAAMIPETVVWLASMTKAITSTAAMQQVDRGTLILDQPAAEICPELKDRQVLDGFEADGSPRLRPAEGTITLRNLLTHTSGFVYDTWNPGMSEFLSVTGTPGILSCENATLSVPLGFDPNTAWDYGPGIDWAGKMVERVTGMRLGDYLAEHLFGPLGMTSTAFRITEEMRARLATVHSRVSETAFSLMPDLEVPQDPEFQMGGGGLYSTVQDYARFVRMILNRGTGDDGARVLSAETVAMMSVNQMGANRVCMLKTVDPELSGDAEFFPGLEKSWGLSFMINEEQAPTGRPPGSLAWAGVANTFFWIDPTNGIGGVFAAQVLPFADAKSMALFEAFETAVYECL